MNILLTQKEYKQEAQKELTIISEHIIGELILKNIYILKKKHIP